MIPAPLVWLLVAFAGYRAWRLAGHDDVTLPIRRRVFYLHPDGTWCNTHSRWRWGHKLLTCQWCLGSWVTLAAGALVHLYVADLITGEVRNRAGFAALVLFAAAALAGFLGELDRS